MTRGMAWDENRPYTDPENSEIGMELAADRYRSVLERPFVAEPGAQWIYSGGSLALVGALIERGTGRSLPDFAREALFEPLGISAFEWSAGRDDIASVASGLRLTVRDLLKIGRLVLGKGVFEGRRVSPKAGSRARWARSHRPVTDCATAGSGSAERHLHSTGNVAGLPASSMADRDCG